MTRLFTRWDADESGLLTAEEIVRGSTRSMLQRWDGAVNELDINHDGKLTMDEFVGSTCHTCMMMMVDRNRDGQIEIRELLRYEAHGISFGSVLDWMCGDVGLVANEAARMEL
eukprot:g615.t1